MTDTVRVIEFKDGRPFVVPGSVASVDLTDAWLQYIVDAVADEATRIAHERVING